MLKTFRGGINMRKLYVMCCMIACLFLCGCANEEITNNDNTSAQVIESSEVETITQEVTADTTQSSTEDNILKEPIELTVYSQLSSYVGEQQGWFAKIMLDKFNVRLNIICDSDGTFDERMKSGNMADIIVFGSTSGHYMEAVEGGKLLDWEENNLLAEHGSYILENMPYALEHNRNLTPEGKIFGFGHGVATSIEDYEDCFYVWDIRWDLYKQLGYPKVNDLDDLIEVFEAMKALSSVDENGNETYAMSIWSDWDENMAMHVKSMASAYYGYDEFHMGLYDIETGNFYGALEKNGPYLGMLSFFNTLYRRGLLDPESRTQTYDDVVKKLTSGGVLFSVFNYAGGLTYNTENHFAENKYMASLMPEEASPIVYGMSVYGGNRVWAIGADTKYPELCMEILNWLCTPEGRMTYAYGPQGVTWDYDTEGNTYFTEMGKSCYYDGTTMLTGEYAGYSFYDGCPQVNNITWSYNAQNPDSNGETYNPESWKSNVAEAVCDTEQDWRSYMGVDTTRDYIRSQNYVVAPATYYTESEKSRELEASWEQVADCIVAGSWAVIYAESDSEYEALVDKMINDAYSLGYGECIAWCEDEARIRRGLEEAIGK